MFDRRRPPVGAQPGAMAAVPEEPKPRLILMDYAADEIVEKELASPEEVLPYLDEHSITWLHVQGLGDESVIRRLGDLFHIDPLALADVVNTPQRPKAEIAEAQAFIVIHGVIVPEEEQERVRPHQLSLFLGKNYVLTFQQGSVDALEPVRRRLRSPACPVRHCGTDYLMYSIMDTVIDAYFPLLERLGEVMEAVEEEAVGDPRPPIMQRIYALRRAILTMRRSVWPQRQVVSELIRDGAPLVSEEVAHLLRDSEDHLIEIIEVLDTYQDITSELMNAYLSSVANRTNEIMKVLTIIATIFIPLTFIVGVYGMNFQTEPPPSRVLPWNMPELYSPYGYLGVWAVMVAISLFMLWRFWKLGWLGGGHKRHP
ncbi:MAG TPA: magnesium/cobalt transporter CorA [Armatimonadota bacterium]